MDESLFAGFVSGTAQTLVGHPLDTMKVWRQQNIHRPHNIFSGLKYPLFTGSILASIQFTSSTIASVNIRKQTGASMVQADTIGGLCAGLVSGILTSPIDKYKIKMQTKTHKSRYGLFSCIVREVPACGIYFGSYAALREQKQSVLISGAIAGTLSWLLTYPLDIAKTQIQSGESPNIRTVYNKLRTGQILLSNGLGFCLARAFLINGIGFAIYEKCLLV
jgi:solute carrier family 25 carnitine/acylcarnitine transporter 20/29